MIKYASYRPGIIEVIISKKKEWWYDCYIWDKLTNIFTHKDRYIEPEDIHYLGFGNLEDDMKKYIIKLFLNSDRIIEE